MKVGFSGAFLSQPNTGIGQYSRNLLQQMIRLDPSIEWHIVASKQEGPAAAFLKVPPNVHVHIIPPKQWLGASLAKLYWEQIQVPRCFKKQGVELIHYPYPANPGFPKSKSPKILVTVHDTIPWERPEYRERMRSRFYQNNALKALKKADHIIAVSHETAVRLEEQRVRGPVTVIHEAADPFFGKRLKRPKRLKKSKRSVQPYFIYIGGYDPRKNVKRLVEAYQEYIVPLFGVDLMLVGAKNLKTPRYAGFKETAALQALLGHVSQKTKTPGKIRLTDSMALEELVVAYRQALAFVNVSLDEGFNLPLLEAANCDLPIITSDLPIHREVVGNHALFCDPKSTKSIGETLLHFLQEPELRQNLKAAASEITTQYSWEKAAKETLEVYKLMRKNARIE